ncbi:unnamed protein product [Lactuca saligna]|uniref:DCD domain-containing protein n=1 Tax=Lactuca saligna TaxID=75948 RepID=A0AA35YH34_LACSI|nr:unnamed protein product [Lactuca saligna]
MGGKKQNKKKILEKEMKESSTFSNYSVPARNLRKDDLGSVIFGCKHNTINECLTNHLFGLPATHFSYIKNIKEGLVLFLFNYSDRKLHGVYEAASPGSMNINRYAWVADTEDCGYTQYPAQVRVRVRQQCHPLSENQFKPVIADNYYEDKHFYFELDHHQTKKLMSLFTPSPVNPSSSQIATRSSFPLRQPNSFKNMNQTSGSSYASVVGQHATPIPTSSTWSALFKAEASFENEGESDNVVARNHDEWPKDEDKSNVTHANTWDDDVGCVETHESDWGYEGKTIKDEWQNEEDEVLSTNSWEETKLTHTAIDEAQYVQTTFVSELNPPDANTNKDDLPSSSSQLLDENLDHQLQLCSKENETNVEENDVKDNSLVPVTALENCSTNLESLVAKLLKEVEELKESHLKQVTNINQLEQELDKSKRETQQLKNRIDVLESGSVEESKNDSNILKSVMIVGGFDGCLWLPCLDSYSPCYDIRIPLTPMNVVKKYGSAATMNGELYHFGGINPIVESYSPTSNQWVLRPPLYWSNIHVAGASVNNKLFVAGGNKESHFSSEVEYLDLSYGKWLPVHSMNSKRSGPAAVELNNALYVTGGFDGQSYSSSVERLDPREEKWSALPDMNKRKGCHSMVVLNDKLYTVGGYDGEKYLQTVECFDTRMGCWVECAPMNVCRGNFGAFVIGEKLFAIGGSTDNNKILEIVECYKEGSGWEVCDVKAIGKRSHFSAIVM